MPFAHHVRRVAQFAQVFGQQFVLQSQRIRLIVGYYVMLHSSFGRILAGHQRGPRRRAHWRRVVPMQRDTVRQNGVNVGRGNLVVPVQSNVVPALMMMKRIHIISLTPHKSIVIHVTYHIIAQYKNYIRLPFRCTRILHGTLCQRRSHSKHQNVSRPAAAVHCCVNCLMHSLDERCQRNALATQMSRMAKVMGHNFFGDDFFVLKYDSHIMCMRAHHSRLLI